MRSARALGGLALAMIVLVGGLGPAVAGPPRSEEPAREGLEVVPGAAALATNGGEHVAPDPRAATPSAAGMRWYDVAAGFATAAAWSGAAGGTAPPALVGAAAASDPNATGGAVTVVVGGRDAAGDATNATWTYTSPASSGPSTWALAPVAGIAPPPRLNASLDFDPDLGRFVLFGGDDDVGAASNATWYLDPASWTWTNATAAACALACPAARESAGLAFDGDRADHASVLFGGCDGNGSAPRNDTWVLTATGPGAGTWTNATGPGAPPARCDADLATISAVGGGQALALFGGAAGPGAGGLLNDTWKFQSGNWTRFPGRNFAAGTPPPLEGAALVFDWETRTTLLTGGTALGNAPENATWQFGCLTGLCTWTNLTASVGGIARAFAAGGGGGWGSEPVIVGGLASNGTVPSAGTWVLQNVTNLSGSVGPLETLVNGSATLSPSLQGGPNNGGAGDASFALWTITPPGGAPFVRVGGPSPAPPVTVPLPTAGDWTVELAEVDRYDILADAGFSIRVDTLIARARANLSATDVSLPTAFTGTVAGTYEGPAPGFFWKFGDGTTARGANVTHTYTIAGTYTASLNATTGAGPSVDANVTVVVHRLPGLHLAASPSPVDLGLPVNLSAEGLNGTSPFAYTWTFGDGSPGATGPGVLHTYNQSGIEAVAVTARDAVGRVATATLYLPVNPALSLRAGALPDATSPGAPIAFGANASGGSGGYRFAWTFGDGSRAPGPEVSHAFAGPGTYQVTAWANDTLGSSTSLGLGVTIAPPSAPTPRSGTWIEAGIAAGGFLGILVGAVVVLRRRGPRAGAAGPPGP